MSNKAEHNKKNDTIDNVYLNGRREWMERYGSYVADRDRWRFIAFLSMIITFVSVMGLVLLQSQSKVIPYVVEVDKLGRAVYAKMIEETKPVDERIVRASVARWISNARSVYFDAHAQQNVLKEVYALLNTKGPSKGMLNEHFRANDPYERAETESVTVDIESVDQLSKTSWKIEWIESVYSREGTIREKILMEATVSIVINPPTDTETILLNPLGIYIDSFRWSKRLK